MDEFAAHVVAVVPRRDHATLAGSRASRRRGWPPRADAVAEAAVLLREAVAARAAAAALRPQTLALASSSATRPT